MRAGKARRINSLTYLFATEDEKGVREMNITDKGLEEIEKAADRHHNFVALLICQVLREVRELRKLTEVGYNACDCGNCSADCTDKSQDKHS